MVMRFTDLVIFSVATLLLVHASARNLQQTHTLPLNGGANAPTKAGSPIFDAPLKDQRNFIVSGGAAAGAGGIIGIPGSGGSGGSGGGGNGMTSPISGVSDAFGGIAGGISIPGIGGGSTAVAGGAIPNSSSP